MSYRGKRFGVRRRVKGSRKTTFRSLVGRIGKKKRRFTNTRVNVHSSDVRRRGNFTTRSSKGRAARVGFRSKRSHPSSSFAAKVIKSIQPPNVFERTNGITSLCSQNAAALITGTTSIGPAPFSEMMAPEDLIGFLQTAAQATSTPAIYNTEKVLVESCRQIHTLTNASNVTVTCRWYDLRPRRDMPFTMMLPLETNITNMITYGFLGTSQSAQLPDSTGSPNINDISVTLFDNPLICTWFTIKLHTFKMAPGSTKTIVRHAPPMLVNGARLLNPNTAALYSAYLRESHVWACQFFGQNSNDALSNDVGTATCKIVYMSKIRYVYRYNFNTRGLRNTYEQFSQTTGGQVIVQPSGVSAPATVA